MPKIVVFCEDSGHEKVVAGLLRKMLPHRGYEVRILSARHGKGRALSELEDYLNQVRKGFVSAPDAVVVAIDANCKGYNGKKKEIDEKKNKDFPDHIPFIHAIPDPHVERWILKDSKAFKAVFGKGCVAPNQKCEKDRYKNLLNDAIKAADGEVTISWIEHADAIVEFMDIDFLSRDDESIRKFVEETNAAIATMQRLSGGQ